MLWSLLSSAYIIYLYRKLKAEREPQTTKTAATQTGSVGAALDTFNQRLDSLEAKLAGTKAEETAR
jgi:hypothetical protein